MTVPLDLGGHVLGNWRLVRPLGVGGFGAVYEAEHLTIPGRRARSRSSTRRWRWTPTSSAASSTRPAPPAAPSTRTSSRSSTAASPRTGLCYVVMELLRGQSLQRALAGPRRPPGPSTSPPRWPRRCDAAHGLRHRPPRPQARQHPPRPPLGQRPGVRQGARLRHRQAPGRLWNDPDRTWLGTPPYMAPEQWQTLPDIDGRADLYALGVILFRCLTGPLPFSASTPYGWLTAHLREPVPEPGAFEGPPALLELTRRLLAKGREDRPATAQEVMRELLHHKGEAPPERCQHRLHRCQRKPGRLGRCFWGLSGWCLAVGCCGGIANPISPAGPLAER